MTCSTRAVLFSKRNTREPIAAHCSLAGAALEKLTGVMVATQRPSELGGRRAAHCSPAGDALDKQIAFYCASAGDAPDSAGRPTSEGPGAAPATHELAFRTRAIFKFVFIWFVSLFRIHLLFVFYSIGFYNLSVVHASLRLI
jgi:hypothetical protein